MKVVMLCKYPFPKYSGGIATHIRYLVKEFGKINSNDLNLFVLSFGEREYDIIKGNIKLKIIKINWYYWILPFLPLIYLNREIKKIRPDIIHLQGLNLSPYSISILALRFNCKKIITVHGFSHLEKASERAGKYKYLIFYRFEKLILNKMDRIICCSKYMARIINSTFGVPETKTYIIPNGINTALFKEPINLEQMKTRFAQPNERLILFVGRLVQVKGVSAIVEAAPYLKDLDVKIVIAGEGYLKEDLIRRVNELDLSSRVYVTGFLDEETIRGLFRVADVCLIPSTYEPFGIVALEAMAGGSPIVTTGSGGLGEILEPDRTAIFVEPNPESIACGVRKILTDHSYADHLRKEAAEQVKSYEWSVIAASTIGAYTGMLENIESK